MSLAGRKRRRRTEIRQKRKRREKLNKLLARFKAAKTEGERTTVMTKLHKRAPFYQVPK